MITENQKGKARIFSDMHKENKMFLLPGAWNAGSAYVFEKQGFKAIGTSSAGIAYDLGYPDGECISFDDLLWVVEKIARRIDIPISVDIERGYSEINEEIKENARKLLFAGAVGFNIEDGLPNGELTPLDIQTEKIKVLSELKSELGIDLVINARTDIYPLDETNEGNLNAAIERCNAFAEAGADCVFPIGARDDITISKLAKRINAPINIFLRAGLCSFENLDKIGVRRLSTGCNAVRFAYSNIINMAASLSDGDATKLLDHAFSSGKANDYFSK